MELVFPEKDKFFQVIILLIIRENWLFLAIFTNFFKYYYVNSQY